MKIIYNDRELMINASKNISIYNLLLICLKKLGVPLQNITNFYISDQNGRVLKNSEPIDTKRKYILKGRLLGGNPFQTGNSSFVILIGSILIGILSVSYYQFYLKKILINVPLVLQGKLDAYAIQQSVKHRGKNSSFSGNLIPKVGEQKKMSGGEGTFQKIGDFFKDSFFGFTEKLHDDENKICLCNFLGEIPEYVLKKDTSNFSNILSATLFTTFIIFVTIPLITNTTSFFHCKKPHFSSIIYSILFLLIPLAIAYVIPEIINFLDKMMVEHGKTPIFQNFKLATSNTILAIVLIIYMIINRKGISPFMYLALILCFIVFGIINFTFNIGNNKIGINQIIGKISQTISNWLTNSGPVPPPSFVPDEKVNLTSNYKPNFSVPNVSECYERYNTIFDLFKTAIISLVGFVFLSSVYAEQIKKACS